MKKLLSVFLFLALLSGCNPARATHEPTEENKYMPGLSPLALEFGGTDAEDYIDYGFLPSVFSERTPTTISVVLWIKPALLETTHYMVSFSNDQGGLFFYVDERLSGARRLYVDSNVFIDVGAWETGDVSADLNLNAWNLVGFTYNMASNANDPVIYLNGTARAITETDPPASASNYNRTGTRFMLGNVVTGSKTPTTNGYDGQMFDVRVYNRILTAGEMLTIYNGGTPSMSAGITPHVGRGNPSGLVFHGFAVRTPEFGVISNPFPFQQNADLTLTSLGKMSVFSFKFGNYKRAKC